MPHPAVLRNRGYTGQPREAAPPGTLFPAGRWLSSLTGCAALPELAQLRAPGMERLQDPLILLFAIASNAIALLLLGLAWWRPRAARIAFAVLFGWAAWYNASLAWNDPSVFHQFNDLAWLSIYKDFIEGPFHTHTQRWIGAIAFGQGLVALGLLVGGRLRPIAAIGGIVFLVAIAPLGVGSAFPASLLLALGLFLSVFRMRPSSNRTTREGEPKT